MGFGSDRMSDERFELLDETIFDNQKQAEDGGRVTYWVVEYQQRQELVDLLNELNDESEQLKEQLQLIRKDLTHIMLLLLNDEIVKQLSDYDMKVFERLSKA